MKIMQIGCLRMLARADLRCSRRVKERGGEEGRKEREEEGKGREGEGRRKKVG